MEIVLSQLDSEETKIERPEKTRETMPGDVKIDDMEYGDEDGVEQGRFEIWRLHGSDWLARRILRITKGPGDGRAIGVTKGPGDGRAIGVSRYQ